METNAWNMHHPNNNIWCRKQNNNLTHKETQKIQTIMNNIIKRILQVPQSTPNDAITIETGILNIQTIT